MAIPPAFQNSLYNLDYYQGVIIAQVAVMLVIYIILKIIHFIKWGNAEDEQMQAEKEGAKPESSEEEATTKKWDQKLWDIYFPIIYTNHLAAMSLSLIYIPYIFSTILAYIHFGAFCGMIIINIFIKDAEEGEGNRTKFTRIMWIIMCVTNIIQIINGLTGVPKVL